MKANLIHNCLYRELERIDPDLRTLDTLPRPYLNTLIRESLDNYVLGQFYGSVSTEFERAKSIAPTVLWQLKVYLCKLEGPAIIMRRYAERCFPATLQVEVFKASLGMYMNFIIRENYYNESHHTILDRCLKQKVIHKSIIERLYPVVHFFSLGASGIGITSYKLFYLTPYIHDMSEELLQIEPFGLSRKLHPPMQLPPVVLRQAIDFERRHARTLLPENRYKDLVAISKATGEFYNCIAISHSLLRFLYFYVFAGTIESLCSFVGLECLGQTSVEQRAIASLILLGFYFIFKMHF